MYSELIYPSSLLSAGDDSVTFIFLALFTLSIVTIFCAWLDGQPKDDPSVKRVYWA